MDKIGLSYDDILLIPNYSTVRSRIDVDLTTRATRHYKINLPIISANMDTITEFRMANEMRKFGALGIVHRFNTIDEESNIVRELKDNDNDIIAASIGVSGDYKKRLEKLVESGANIICIDVAHGHHKLVKDTIELCQKYDVDSIAGNIATAEAAKFLCDCGADAVKVGIGPGSMCTTRINTGFGVPQITAIEEAYKVCKDYDVPIIADGGIKNSGDVAKALAVGAETVMSGALFAGCKETPGIVNKEGNFPNYKLYKRYRGSASLESKIIHKLEDKNIEGISVSVEYRGPIKYVIQNIEDGLRSALSYGGARNISEFRQKVSYIRVSSTYRSLFDL